MKKHLLKVHPSKKRLEKKDQLSYKLAEFACSKNAKVSPKESIEMVVNRIIDNAGVSLASLNRSSVIHARAQALDHPRTQGANVLGLPSVQTFSPEWASWANHVAVRELDYHDTFLAKDYSHPADCIPSLIAISQVKKKSAKKLLEAINICYEVHVCLVKSICLHEHKKDHIAHLTPAIICGLAHLLNLEVDVIYQALNQGLHLSFQTRQSRKGDISSWKAYAPAFAGKIAIESVDRAMRGEKSPSPIYEGEDSILAYMLGGESYEIFLPEKKDEKVAILETYTKEHSAEYQAQAFIDLAFELKEMIEDLNEIDSILINTSHHTHYVIGTGSKDPQKLDPFSSRETLDHSLMYIFATALQDGFWDHEKSYLEKSRKRKMTERLMKKIKTKELSLWTKEYHQKKAFGGEVIISLKNRKKIKKSKKLANAHPLGQRPFKRENYVNKFLHLSKALISKKEQERFLNTCYQLNKISHSSYNLNIQVENLRSLKKSSKKGIF